MIHPQGADWLGSCSSSARSMRGPSWCYALSLSRSSSCSSIGDEYSQKMAQMSVSSRHTVLPERSIDGSDNCSLAAGN